MTADPIPCVHGLRESYGAGPAPVRAVRGSDLDVAPDAPSSARAAQTAVRCAGPS